MSSRWPGWRTLPGIEIAPLADKARAQGEPWKMHSYVWGPYEGYVTSCAWQVGADGTASMTGEQGWEPMVEDGMVTGFRGKKGGTIEGLVQITSVVVPEGEPPWSPALTIRVPPEQIGMFRRGDTMADGIDLDTENPGGSIAVSIAGTDGGMTTLIWGITAESAASVIALIRERHGEPAVEFTAGSAEAVHDAVLDLIGTTGVFTCAHEHPQEGP